jgi:hypothetical protein
MPADHILSSYACKLNSDFKEELWFLPDYKTKIREALANQSFSLNLDREKDIRAFKIMPAGITEENLVPALDQLIQAFKAVSLNAKITPRYESDQLIIGLEIFR